MEPNIMSSSLVVSEEIVEDHVSNHYESIDGAVGRLFQEMSLVVDRGHYFRNCGPRIL